MYKVGDFVNYTGRLSQQQPQKNCIIKEFYGPNETLNQQMAILDKVEGWVAVAELKEVEKPYVIVIHKPTSRAFSMTRNYGVLNPDLGIIDPPKKFVEDWDGWLVLDVPAWVDEMGDPGTISKHFHGYWLY
jgi:hypothetical protein